MGGRGQPVAMMRFHDLRHTFARRMGAAGVPRRTLQGWVGHREPQTTAIYADYAPSAREAEWVELAFTGCNPPGRAPTRAAVG